MTVFKKLAISIFQRYSISLCLNNFDFDSNLAFSTLIFVVFYKAYVLNISKERMYFVSDPDCKSLEKT